MIRDLDDLQVAIRSEVVRRWPHEQEARTAALATAEELAETLEALSGRLAGILRSVLKRTEHDRGTAEEWTAKMREEVGQAGFVLASLAELEGFSLFVAMANAYVEVVERPDPDEASSEFWTNVAADAVQAEVDALDRPNPSGDTFA